MVLVLSNEFVMILQTLSNFRLVGGYGDSNFASKVVINFVTEIGVFSTKISTKTEVT